MKFKSALVTQASGSVGGLTASRNRGGMYLRARAMPTNPASEFQTSVRNLFSELSTAWVNELTNAQRLSWTTYGELVPRPDALGEDRFLSGLNWYQACNVTRLQGGLSRIDSAPTVYSMASLTLPTIAGFDVGDQEATINFANSDAWATAVGGALLVYAGRAQNPSINFFKGPYRFAGAVLGAGTPPTSPAAIVLPFTFGSGQKVPFRFVAVQADGRISPPVTLFRSVA